MTDSIDWARATREEIAAAAPGAIAVLPLGSTEQHGPHLATGTDHLIAAHVAGAATRHYQGFHPLLLLPTLAYGASGHHVALGGTLSLGADTLRGVLRDIVASLGVIGVPALVMINGHNGNSPSCQDVVQEHRRESPMLVATLNYWATAEFSECIGTAFMGHAGGLETAIAAATSEDLIRPRQMRPSPGGFQTPPTGVSWTIDGEWRDAEGFFGDPRGFEELDGAGALAAAGRGAGEALDHVSGQLQAKGVMP